MAIYQIVENQAWRAQEVVNVHHYTSTSPLSTSQLEEAAEALRDARVALDDATNLANDWSWRDITARRVDVGGLPGLDYQAASGIYVGSVTATNATANQVAALVSFAANSVKPRRGRSYLAGIWSGQMQDSGLWTTGLVADMAVWAAAIMELTVTGDTLFKTAVTLAGNPPLVTASNVLTEFVPRDNPATQRRRRIGSGG